ncbi:MAG: amino acid adenylation domain-containing protein, partial [Acidobacteriota bacterium]
MKRSLLRVSRAKRKLLQAKLRAEGLADSGVTGSGVQTIPRRADRQSHPLSFSQQRLWFLDQLEPGLSAYNIPTLLHLSGELEVPVLAQTLTEILRRHEVLRARFTNQDGRPHQTIAPLRPPTLPIVDLTALDKETREATARRWARREIGRPFDLAQGPLLRLALLRLEAERHLALLVVHHIVSDGWSMGVLVRDLGEIYRALRTGAVPRLAPLPIDYADFAAWQRQWLAGETLHQQLDFWRQQLTDLARLDLPTDRPRPAVQTYRGASERVDLGSELMPRLEALSRGAGGSTTLFMTVLAAFDVLLYRTTSQRDLAVGTPIANRNRAETEGLIGFFVNTLVLRTRLRGETDFLSLLRDVRRRTVAAYAHQDLPFDKLVEELEPDRDLSHTPLFQVMVSLHNAPPSPPDLPGLRLAQVPFDPETVMFDLMLNVAPDNGRWIAGLGYNQDLFDAVRVRRLLRHFHRLLEGIAADPGQILEGLPLLSHAEQHQLMTEANDTAMPEAAPCCLHEPFLTQARERPEAVAIRAGDRAVTYGELQARVHRLAHRLRRLGVGPEDRVAVFHRRSPDLLVALLGILEAGGTYVALDPAYPSERLAFMLADTAASVVLTEAALVDDLPASDDPGREISVLRLDADGPEIAREPATAPPPRASERHLAYLIYTSGSTGRPKGVAIEHRSAVAMLRWARGVFPPACLEAVLASTSVCFDLSIYEIFLPLATGGQVVLVDDALALLQPGTCSGITLINTVPSAMTELMRADAVPAGVEGVNLAGEPIAGELVRDLYARTSVRRVYNLYGPSEDTTYSTFSRLPAGTVATPPIGRPVGDSRAYLLDRSGQPVPSGVPGEIYLGGAGVARGYLDRPRQTAERFLPDPFVAMAASGVGERLYRTGDQAHWRDEGELTFLGRIDHQIKLRGFRIELGEIEAVLRSQPQVRQAVALVRQDLPGG